MSKEYIEREAAKRALRIWITGCVLNGDNESADRFRDCIDILDSLDTADVAPVRHGRWLTWEEQFPAHIPSKKADWVCSVPLAISMLITCMTTARTAARRWTERRKDE